MKQTTYAILSENPLDSWRKEVNTTTVIPRIQSYLSAQIPASYASPFSLSSEDVPLFFQTLYISFFHLSYNPFTIISVAQPGPKPSTDGTILFNSRWQMPYRMRLEMKLELVHRCCRRHTLFDVISANSHTISAYPEINFNHPNQTNITTKSYVDPKRVLLQLAYLLCTRIYWLSMIFAIATY
jgi:hypothetical protein